MRVGFVSYWFNRGQATITRHLRGALDDRGHQTFVLARPTSTRFSRPGHIAESDVWDQPDVTRGSAWTIPRGEIERWADDADLDVVVFMQNYQLDDIAAVRASGRTTIGWFVWEDFSEEHVADTRAAFDRVFSLTRVEHARYLAFGIDSRFLPWGCHPEWHGETDRVDPEVVDLLYPGGFRSRRKPLMTLLRAFAAVEDPRARLTIKLQALPPTGGHARLLSPAGVRSRVLGRAKSAGWSAEWVRDRMQARRGNDTPLPAAPPYVRSNRELLGAVARDDRVRLIVGDLSLLEYQRVLRSSAGCVAPSRWEGLGLHLFEMTGFGLPIVTNDAPPMNEIVHHDKNGLLVPSYQSGRTSSGVPVVEANEPALTAAMTELCDDERRAELSEGARLRRSELDWTRTIEAADRLIRDLPVDG